MRGEKMTKSLAGKTVAISGATGGIGRELCTLLAKSGASLILLDRNPKKSEALEAELKESFPELEVERITVDLEDARAVKKTAEVLKEFPLDALILNAGAYKIPRHKCDTGYDNIYQINFVSPYYLSRALAPHIEERGGKIVAVGSIAHNYSHIDESDIDFKTRKKHSRVYGNAKRYLMFSLFGLFEGSTALTVAHPGITLTNITSHYPKFLYFFMKPVMKIIFMKPKKACLSIYEALFENTKKNEWIGPRFFNVWGKPKKQILKTCSAEEARKICEIADEVYRRMEEM